MEEHDVAHLPSPHCPGPGLCSILFAQVRVVDGEPVIVSLGAEYDDDTSLNAPRGGGHHDGAMGGEEPCLNFAGYPTPLVRWAQYCRYLAYLDNNNFVETTCKGRPGVSGAPLWVYVPMSANITTTGISKNTTTGSSRFSGGGGGTSQAVQQGRRVMCAVLTAGIPGGPTGAVRINPVLRRWVRQVQQNTPCVEGR
ncbi:hypothetical protein Vafri_8925 [Volvox africanus]|uniref:Uncharacterized protein n=1 Tax=Volvox africanus TaxID=51714 RepID=A0A8J4EZ87_9CHLO|nr:hypothetical protein Vafri_8925 [Volvox africanus]